MYSIQRVNNTAEPFYMAKEAIGRPRPPFPPELAACSRLDLTMIFDYQARYLGRGAAEPAP